MTSPPASPQLNGHASPPPRQRGAGLLFRAPAGETETETGPQPAAGETPPQQPHPLGGSPSVSDVSSDEPLEDHGSDPISSRGSSADPASVRPMTQRAQAAAARQAVKIAGSMAHQYLARDEAAQAVGLFLIDDEVAEQIGDPLARIMARHSPADGAMSNPDVADGIAAMLGVANFVRITIEKSSEATAIRVANSPAAPPADV